MKTIPFDPGYSVCFEGVYDSIELVYGAFEIKSLPLKQKKFEFSIAYQKFKSLVDLNAGFYLGCLLWASYIKAHSYAEITDNVCLDTTFDENNATEEIDFIIDFTQNKLSRDAKYYIGKNYIPDERYLNVFKTYREFLVLNKGFVKLKKSQDLLLPKNLKVLDDENKDVVEKTIESAISEKKLSLLFDVYDLIFQNG